MNVPRPLAVARGVHVTAAPVGTLRDVPPLPADLRTADGLPPRRRREHLAARGLLRHVLAEVVGPRTAREPLAVRAGGQPVLPGCPNVEVSLSHSRGWVAAAVAVSDTEARVGVDVQAPEPVNAGLLRRCCTPAARVRLAELPATERDREFAWLWTVQEACVKASGGGLADRPWTVPVEVGHRAGLWRQFRWTALRPHFGIPVSCAYGPAKGSPIPDSSVPEENHDDLSH